MLFPSVATLDRQLFYLLFGDTPLGRCLGGRHGDLVFHSQTLRCERRFALRNGVQHGATFHHGCTLYQNRAAVDVPAHATAYGSIHNRPSGILVAKGSVCDNITSNLCSQASATCTFSAVTNALGAPTMAPPAAEPFKSTT